MSSLPDWLERRYGLLWSEFSNNVFKFEDAAKVLMDKNRDAWEQIPNFLSELHKAGWLFVEPDAKDARVKVYRLKSREEAVKEVFALEKKELTRSDLESLLKRAADLIRTRVDYRFILILLFLKRISDKWEMEFEKAYGEALKDGLKEEDARREARNPMWHSFDLPEEFLWDNVRKDVSVLPEKFSKGLKVVAERNPELKDVIDSVDFVQFARSGENVEILRQLVELFSERKLQHVSPDVLGDAYEWILRYFAPTKAKEGEIYTPREVDKLLVEVLNPEPMESVYDPACGSGGMLIYSYKYIEKEKAKAEADKLFLYGQEASMPILAMAKMNLYIHDIRNCNLLFGDTLLSPKFKEGESFRQFEVVMANPPWNQDGYAGDKLKNGEFWKQRFGFGFVPRQSADWAWIQHMLASAKDDSGRVGVIIDNGCLFRGGKERAIRTAVLEKDWVECVILLPEKLFYNTGASGAILVFRKNKLRDRKGKVLFINASKEFEQHPEVRKLHILGKNHIEKIVGAYKSFVEEKGFARIVDLDEVRQNDYNLNVTLYVMTDEEEEQIDIVKEYAELQALAAERQKVERELDVILEQITRAREFGGDIHGSTK
jgi:type I restriction enzyme M protein